MSIRPFVKSMLTRTLQWTAIGLTGIAATAQVTSRPTATTRPATTRPASAPSARPIGPTIDAWRHDPEAADLRGRVVDAVIEAGTPGTRALRSAIDEMLEHSSRPGVRVPPTVQAPQTEQAVVMVVRDLALRFLEHVADSGMVHAGQFDPLLPLQPYIGRVYLNLVIETPDWFPYGMRAQVVPALRDLYPDGPPADRKTALHTIAADEDFEVAALREQLAYALAQWGDRSLVEPRLADLRSGIGDAATGDQLWFVRQLAIAHYRLREYGESADLWQRYLRGREAIDSRPQAFDYYNAACSASLAGEIPIALAQLERCGELMRSGELDESERVERRLFETDPELRAVRSTPQFQQILARTFADDRQ